MPHLNRRQLLATVGAGLVTGFAPAERQSDRIKAENDREGTTDWQLTYTRVETVSKYRSPMIEGFVSRASVRAGDKLDVFVSTSPASPVQLDLYRLGYYQGTGGRHVLSVGPLPSKTQLTPPIGDERLRECQWEKWTT